MTVWRLSNKLRMGKTKPLKKSKYPVVSPLTDFLVSSVHACVHVCVCVCVCGGGGVGIYIYICIYIYIYIYIYMY